MNKRLVTDLCFAVAIISIGLVGLYQRRQIRLLEDTLAVDHKITDFMLQDLQKLQAITKH